MAILISKFLSDLYNHKNNISGKPMIDLAHCNKTSGAFTEFSIDYPKPLELKNVGALEQRLHNNNTHLYSIFFLAFGKEKRVTVNLETETK